MSLKENFKRFRDNLVINQVQQAKLPEFEESPVRRYKITFSGRVQKVGFRLEVCEFAKRLQLTGYCKNLDNGDVLAELQGQDDKIQYLIMFMESLVRIKIRNKVVEEMEVLDGEVEFLRK